MIPSSTAAERTLYGPYCDVYIRGWILTTLIRKLNIQLSTMLVGEDIKILFASCYDMELI